jgi:hypothetical protein
MSGAGRLFYTSIGRPGERLPGAHEEGNYEHDSWHPPPPAHHGLPSRALALTLARVRIYVRHPRWYFGVLRKRRTSFQRAKR